MSALGERQEINRGETGLQPEKPNPFEFITNRDERLQAINQFLGERKLRSLKSVGNFEDPRLGTELLEIRQVYDRPQRFYTVVTFGARFPDTPEGKPSLGEYSLIFKANGAVTDGSVYVTRIDISEGKAMYVLTDQYRIAHDERMLELPRGFAKETGIEAAGEEYAQSVDIAELTGARALRELREEAGITKVKKFKHCGKLAEDSSIEASDVNVYLVVADSKLSEQQLDISELGTAVVIMTPEGLYGSLQKGEIRDMHSLSAFFTVILKDPEEGKRFAKFLSEQ